MTGFGHIYIYSAVKRFLLPSCFLLFVNISNLKDSDYQFSSFNHYLFIYLFIYKALIKLI